MRNYPKIIAVAVLFMALSACSTTSTISVIEPKYAINESECQVDFFKKTQPESAYQKLAEIETHVQRNMFFGGDAKLDDQAYAELKTKTCNLGGNAVIINDYVESRAAEFSHVHVWATSIKLRP